MRIRSLIVILLVGMVLNGLFEGRLLLAQTGIPRIAISQIYGGGGNQGATLRNDFIELLNRGDVEVDVTGWSVQYASASGSSWDRTVLTGRIQPGQYFLVQEGAGNNGTLSLPTPDIIGGLNLSATSGKVALVNNSSNLSGTSPSGSAIIDFVGYGNANFAEGNSAPELNNSTAAIRKSDGCTDTGDNRADFGVGAPVPRNSASARNLCSPISGPQPPQISREGVTNAASFLAGSIAPGEIITIFGQRMGPENLTTLQLTPDGQSVTSTLAGTTVWFDGIAAPIIYTVAGQVSVVVPYSITNATTQLRVEYDGQMSNVVSLDVAPSAPGVFTLDASGSAQAAVLNQDYGVNGPSAPARRGSVITIFATGGGTTTPSTETGSLVGTPLPYVNLRTAVRIGGQEATVHYAGGAPGLVSGVVQINAEIPASLGQSGSIPIQVTIGNASSQPGVTVWVAADSGSNGTPDGTGPLIDQRLAAIRSDPTVPPLQEIPHDRIGIPSDWLALVSWNIQTGGTSTSPTALRPPMVHAALGEMFSGTYQLMASQEIPNAASAEFLRTMLPGGSTVWQSTFLDTTDSMDNGFWYREPVKLLDAASLLSTGQLDSSGRIVADPARSLHPPQVAHFQAGDFDFTLLTVHLTFADGDANESAREMRNVLDYLDAYFSLPEHDPDVIVCGDFNLPSLLSGTTASDGITLDRILDQDPRFETGEHRFAVTVHTPTSRSSAANEGTPANNYDHCVVSADTLEELIQVRRVATEIITDHADDPEVRLTSDHFPIVAFFRTRGDGVSLDHKPQIRVEGITSPRF